MNAGVTRDMKGEFAIVTKDVELSKLSSSKCKTRSVRTINTNLKEKRKIAIVTKDVELSKLSSSKCKTRSVQTINTNFKNNKITKNRHSYKRRRVEETFKQQV